MKTLVIPKSKTISVSEAADRIGCSAQSVRRLLDAGEIEDHRPLSDNGWRRVFVASLDRFIERRAKARRKRA